MIEFHVELHVACESLRHFKARLLWITDQMDSFLSVSGAATHKSLQMIFPQYIALEHGLTSHGKIVYHVNLKTWARCPTRFLGEL